MAILADGRAGFARQERQTVHAGVVRFGLILMTTGAVHRSGCKIVVRMTRGQIAVAIGATVGPVAGGGQFRRIDEQRNDLADRVGLVQVFVSVAFQAVAVGDDLGPDCREGDTRNQQVTERHFPEAIHTLCTQWPCGAVSTTHILANALPP